MEMFALSGTDSDSDLELPKINQKKKKKKSEVEKEIEMKDEDFLGSDLEEDNEDNVRAWGSRKKHFYGGSLRVSRSCRNCRDSEELLRT